MDLLGSKLARWLLHRAIHTVVVRCVRGERSQGDIPNLVSSRIDRPREAVDQRCIGTAEIHRTALSVRSYECNCRSRGCDRGSPHSDESDLTLSSLEGVDVGA